ncbi:MAG: hypothetical protein ACM33T_08600 [Solirubrobacterales bacterium]
MRPNRLILLAVLAALPACSDGPFYDTRKQTTSLVAKPKDTVLEIGQVWVCYDNDEQWAEVEKMAAESCAAHGLQSTLLANMRWQCRMFTPHKAVFQCFDPRMTDAQGRYINPLDPKAVAAWRRRTGQTETTAPAVAPTPAPVPTQTLTPPPPAPVPPVVPAPSASDVNPPKPQPSAPTLPPPPAPVPVEPQGSGFQLQPGSWGQAFDRE